MTPARVRRARGRVTHRAACTSPAERGRWRSRVHFFAFARARRVPCARNRAPRSGAEDVRSSLSAHIASAHRRARVWPTRSSYGSQCVHTERAYRRRSRQPSASFCASWYRWLDAPARHRAVTSWSPRPSKQWINGGLFAARGTEHDDMNTHAKTLLLYLFDATSIEASVGEIAVATGLGPDQVRDAAVPGFVEITEWSSSDILVRYGLTPDGRRAARALASAEPAEARRQR